MVYPIPNYERVWVRGRFVDLAKAAREEANYGLTGPVQFVPKATVTLNYASQQIIAMKPFVVFPDATTGYFQLQLPVTDDPDVNPTDFKYEVTEPTGRRYHIKVPIDTPTLFAPGDPLNGQQVIELVNVVPDPENPEGTVQLLKGLTGRGIASVTYRESDAHLIVNYDDGLTQDVGLMPGVYKVAGRSGDVTLTKADVGLNNVNNTADLNKPISNAAQTALDGKAPLSHGHAQGDITGLTSALNGKANSSHSHAISDVSGLQTALDSKSGTGHGHTGMVTSSEITVIRQLTQAQYDALSPKVATTLYVVVG